MELEVDHFQQDREMDCWHAAARMLFAYKHQACIHPLPETYSANNGIGPAQFIDLAKAMGLRTTTRVNQTYSWIYLDDLLRNHGPIWAAGQWNGANHIIVITGVDPGGLVLVNDPAFPAPVVRDIAWFNDRIDKNVDIPLMYLP
jgi:hypothetical protein